MQSLSRKVAAARGWIGAHASLPPVVADTLRQAFDWAYDKAVDGMPGLDGAAGLAARYRTRHANANDAVANLIRRQASIAGVAGFMTGCGGLAALPVAMPANLASALYIQARLIAAVAHLHGHDIASDEVRAMALACLAGSKATGSLRDAGVRLGVRMTRDTAGWLSPVLLKKWRHASHAAVAIGGNGARLAKFAPVVGGVVAGGFDAATTLLVGRTADRVFAATKD